MTFYTYMLVCSDGSFYSGKTINLERRLRQHNGEIKGGAKYTRVRRPVKVVYQKEFLTHLEACSEEARLKTLTHHEKAALGV